MTPTQNSTALQELIEYILHNSEKELLPNSVGSRDIISIEKVYLKAKSLLPKERKGYEQAYNQGDADRDNQQDGNERDFKNCIDYFDKTFKQ